MSDLAKLVVAVDTRQVVTGGKDLDALTSKTERAEHAAGRLGKIMAGLGVAAGVGLAGRQIWDTNKEFERLNTSLVTVTKSQDRANQVFGDLQDFAAKTPFQLREVTEAYIMMRARGLDPTRETMTSLGNLASGMGRSFQDTIQAVGSLAAGEIEPMKQLGFSVMTIGDKVRISSEGVSRTVSRNAYDISKAVAQISDQKFGGGMERQINTLGGAWSNLQDQIDATIYKMGQGGFNTQARQAIQDFTRAIDEATPALTNMATEAVNGALKSVQFVSAHKAEIVSLGAVYASVQVGQIASGWATHIAKLAGEVKSASQATQVWNSATMMYERSSGAANLATKAWNGTIAALGGPVGATIALLGTLAVVGKYAWEASKSSAEKASEEADKYLVRLREEVALLNRKKELENKGRTGEAGLDDPTIRALQAKERYAGELQSAIAAAQADKARLSPENQGEAYVEAVQREARAQAALNKVLADYKEIADGANRIKADALAKSQAAKAATDAESKKLAEKARKEMDEQRRAQEAQRLMEEHKTFVRDLQKDNVTGLALLASGQAGIELPKVEQEIIKLEANAKRLGLVGKELEAVRERVRQMRKIAMEEDAVKDRDATLQQIKDQQEKWKDADRESLKVSEDAMWAEMDAAIRLRIEDYNLAQQKEYLNQLYADGNVTQAEYRDRMIELEKQTHVMTGAFGDLRDTINDWSKQSTNAMVDFFFTGKSGFSDMVSSWLRDLARLAVQRNVMDPLTSGILGMDWSKLLGGGGSSSATSGIGSGLMTGFLGGLPKFAQGTDYVPRDMVAQIHQGERIIPAAQNKGALGATINSTVVVNVDANGNAQMQSGARAGEIGKVIQAATVKVIQDEMRPGGLLQGVGR